MSELAYAVLTYKENSAKTQMYSRNMIRAQYHSNVIKYVYYKMVHSYSAFKELTTAAGLLLRDTGGEVFCPRTLQQ